MNEEMQTDEVPSVHSADLFKAMAALVLFLIALVGGVLPLRIESVGSRVVSCLNTAAGGVFFASAMVHMLPESSETLEDAWGDLFAWGYFLCCIGFLLILCIDHAVLISSANRNKNGRNGHTLVPTEPPDAEHSSKDLRGRLKGRHKNTDSEDLEELEMATISPRALLNSSPISASDRALVGGGGGEREDGPQSLISSTVDDDDDCHHSSGGGGAGAGRRGTRGGNGHAGRHSHSHSHGLGVEGDGVLVRLALLLALSVHSVMEGLGVGAKSTKAYNLLFAIAVHKGLAAYALGASLLQSGVRGNQLTFFVLAFSAMTPLGILLGALIESDGEDDTAGAVCVALAAGTFLYVSLMEVLPPELASTEHGWAKMGSLLAGFFVSAGVGWLVG